MRSIIGFPRNLVIVLVADFKALPSSKGEQITRNEDRSGTVLCILRGHGLPGIARATTGHIPETNTSSRYFQLRTEAARSLKVSSGKPLKPHVQSITFRHSLIVICCIAGSVFTSYLSAP